MSDKDTRPSESTAPACAEVQAELLQARPGAALSPELERHLAECAACRTARAQLVLLDDLAREQTPALPSGFELALRRRLQAVESSQRQAGAAVSRAAPPRRRRLRGVALAAAAVLLVAAGAGLLLPRWLGRSGEPPTYHRLRLSIESGADFEAVLFKVQLPEGVELLPSTAAAIGGLCSWQSPVRIGVNEIDLPLLARRAEGTIRVEIRAGTRVLSREAHLESRGSATRAPEPELRLAWALGELDEGGPR